MAPHYRIFLATAKDTSDEVATELGAKVLAKFTEALPDNEVTIVLAKDEWERSFKEAGSWDAWVREIGAGVDFYDRTPKFNAIMVVDTVLGKATAQMVAIGLDNRRMIGYYNPEDNSIKLVTGVNKRPDVTTWADGWEVSFDF